jgi:hypothetical protein
MAVFKYSLQISKKNFTVAAAMELRMHEFDIFNFPCDSVCLNTPIESSKRVSHCSTDCEVIVMAPVVQCSCIVSTSRCYIKSNFQKPYDAQYLSVTEELY